MSDVGVALTSQLIAKWLEDSGISGVTWVFDARGFDKAGNAPMAAMISFTGGPGLQLEDVLDVVTFQVRCRGPQEDDTGAALMFARRVDATICTATYHGPILIGDVKVIRTGRVGAAPAQFGPRDNAHRVQTSCNYLFEIGSGLT